MILSIAFSAKIQTACRSTSFPVVFVAMLATSAMAQDPKLAEQTNAMIAERDRIQESIARDDNRISEQAKLAVINKEVTLGHAFTADELKKETLFAERDLLLRTGRGSSGNPAQREARLREVNMQISLGREPTAAERTQMQSMIAEQKALDDRMSRNKSDTVDVVKAMVLREQIDQGKIYSPEETKKQSLLAERTWLSRTGGDGARLDPAQREARLREVNMQISLGREPTAAERTQMQSMIAEQKALDDRMSRNKSDTVDVVKAMVLREQIDQGKIYSPEETKKQSLLAERTWLSRTGGDGARLDPAQREARLREVNMQISLGREPTAAERTQMQSMIAEQKALDDRMSRNKSDTVDVVKAMVLREQIDQGKIYSPEETKKQSLLAERTWLSRTGGDGARLDPAQREARLREVNMQISLGREPTAAERTQMQSMIAEQKALNDRMLRNKSDTVDVVKAMVLREQIDQGKIYSPEETKKQSLLAERTWLSRTGGDGARIDPAQREARLREVNMQISLGREPTAAERTQMQNMTEERERLQKDLKRNGPARRDRAGDVAKLEMLNKEIAKRQTPNADAKTSNAAEGKAALTTAPAQSKSGDTKGTPVVPSSQNSKSAAGAALQSLTGKDKVDKFVPVTRLKLREAKSGDSKSDRILLNSQVSKSTTLATTQLPPIKDRAEKFAPITRLKLNDTKQINPMLPPKPGVPQAQTMGKLDRPAVATQQIMKLPDPKFGGATAAPPRFGQPR